MSRPGNSGIVEVVELVAWVLLVGGTALALVVIVLGLLPELEGALYFMVLVLILLLAAWALMSLVFMERRPAARSVAPPTTGAVPQGGTPT